MTIDRAVRDGTVRGAMLYSGMAAKVRELRGAMLLGAPAPAGPPPIDPEVEEALRRELRLAAKARGRSPIISTDTGDVPVARKSLLGQ